MKGKRKGYILFFLILILLSIGCIGVGIYFSKLSKPNAIFGVAIDKIQIKLDDVLDFYRDYEVGDSFTLNGGIQLKLDSEKLATQQNTDPEAFKQYQMMKNLSNSKNQFLFMQNKNDKQLFFSFNQTLGQEELVQYKYVIQDATKYYFVKEVLENYVNDGNCSYFESLTMDQTTMGNFDYLYHFIFQSLKEHLKEEYFKTYRVNQNIYGKDTYVYQVSMSLTDKRIKAILNGVLKDLKTDPQANKILTGIYDDFMKVKLSNERKYLSSKESYTINIYTSTFLYEPMKYEIIYLGGNEKKSYVYEGDDKNGKAYYFENDKLVYQLDVGMSSGHMEVIIQDHNSQQIGSLKYEKETNSISLDYDFDYKNKKNQFVFSSKYQNIERGKSHQNHTEIIFNQMDNNVVIMNGEIFVDMDVQSEAKLEEDLSDSVLTASLTDEKKHQFETVVDRVKARLEK